MKQKKKNGSDSSASKLTDQNWNNPFVGLKIDLPEPPKPPPPPPPTEEEKKQSALSKEDLELLRAFGGDVVIGKDVKASSKVRSRGRLSFQIQRKGKGVKTVTNVKGLEELELFQQMELCNQAKSALGIGARFVEGVLELQGDQVQRAKDWFQKQNFTV